MRYVNTFKNNTNDDTEMEWGHDDTTNTPVGEKGGTAERTPSNESDTDTDFGYEDEDFENEI